MKKKFKFQMENGHIYEGAYEITIKDHIAGIEESDISLAVERLIEAHGGQEIAERLEPITVKPKKRSKEIEVK